MNRVLVIDDSPFIFKAIKRALEPGGFMVVGHGQNGKEGLELINSLSPDIITLDVTMPIMDGLQVAAELSEDVSRRVIMLSAMGDDELVNQAKAFGILHFLSKPFQAEDLLERIRLIAGTSNE